MVRLLQDANASELCMATNSGLCRYGAEALQFGAHHEKPVPLRIRDLRQQLFHSCVLIQKNKNFSEISEPPFSVSPGHARLSRWQTRHGSVAGMRPAAKQASGFGGR